MVAWNTSQENPVILNKGRNHFTGKLDPEHTEYIICECGRQIGKCKCGFKKLYPERYEAQYGHMEIKGMNGLTGRLY